MHFSFFFPIVDKVYKDTPEMGLNTSVWYILRVLVALFDNYDGSGDLFVLLFSQEQRNNIYCLLHVQGCQWHWIMLYFWWTYFLFLINTGGLLLIGQRSGYIGGLSAVGEGDHTCLLRSLFPILLFLPNRVYVGSFPLSPFSMEVLWVLNIGPSHLFPNAWSYIKAFKMVYEELVVTLMVEVLFSFYTTEPLNKWKKT